MSGKGRREVNTWDLKNIERHSAQGSGGGRHLNPVRTTSRHGWQNLKSGLRRAPGWNVYRGGREGNRDDQPRQSSQSATACGATSRKKERGARTGKGRPGRVCSATTCAPAPPRTSSAAPPTRSPAPAAAQGPPRAEA